MPEMTSQLLAELAELEDPKIRAVNDRHGDDHGVPLAALRTIAKRLKKQPDLARELWATGDTAAQIGIEHPELRERAVAIGERLEVLKDYPTPPNCTSVRPDLDRRDRAAARGWVGHGRREAG